MHSLRTLILQLATSLLVCLSFSPCYPKDRKNKVKEVVINQNGILYITKSKHDKSVIPYKSFCINNAVHKEIPYQAEEDVYNMQARNWKFLDSSVTSQKLDSIRKLIINTLTFHIKEEKLRETAPSATIIINSKGEIMDCHLTFHLKPRVSIGNKWMYSLLSTIKKQYVFDNYRGINTTHDYDYMYDGGMRFSFRVFKLTH